MNNPIVKLGIVLVLLVGGGWFGLSSYRKKSAEYENRLGLERVRREFLERAPLARSMADLGKYRFEQQQLFKWYFNELTDHYNRFAAFKDYEKFEDDLEQRKRQKKVKDQEYAQYLERYKAVKAFWDLARAGKYDPVFSTADKGLRFDVYDVQQQPGDKVRLSFALYGTQRKWSEDSSSGSKVKRLTVNAAFQEMVLSGLDGDGKQITEMRATGEPFKIDNPERFIEEFPPGLVFGYYDLPKIPAEVVTIQLTFDLATRSVLTGEDVPLKVEWKQPAPPEWKLAAGARWEGAQEQVREAPEEEAAPAKKGKR